MDAKTRSRSSRGATVDTSEVFPTARLNIEPSEEPTPRIGTPDAHDLVQQTQLQLAQHSKAILSKLNNFSTSLTQAERYLFDTINKVSASASQKPDNLEATLRVQV
ncbi:hypothetical protein WJX73_004416 [Symbiochloris irregularis]|uniref:Uncharacterized protein n=1 Tax=Symbiochloris irregularis TaxID=706552 RepID=A0AAW1NYW7_9CHLO